MSEHWATPTVSGYALHTHNCNTQPWHVHVVSGSARDKLSAALLRDENEGYRTPDFSFDAGAFKGIYAERHHAMAMRRNDAAGIRRDDHVARYEDMLRNLKFYGAPHVAFLFMPVIGDSVRTAGDIGMYAQTLLLSLAAHGFAGTPQTVLGFYPGSSGNWPGDRLLHTFTLVGLKKTNLLTRDH